jgi:hypothetical protein
VNIVEIGGSGAHAVVFDVAQECACAGILQQRGRVQAASSLRDRGRRLRACTSHAVEGLLLGIVWSRLTRAHGPLPSASTASRSVGDCAEWVWSRPSSARHPRVVGRRATFDQPASIRACQRAVLEPALIVGPISATGVSVRSTKLSQNLRCLRRRWRGRGCGSGLTCWAGRHRERSVAWADLHRRVAALVCGPRRGVINRPARLVAIGAGGLFRSGSAVGSGSGRG